MNGRFPSLDAFLARYDGRDAGYLDGLAAEWPPDEALLIHLIDFAAQADPLPQVAATGLLKRYREAGAAFPEALSLRLLDLLPGAVRWEARLHLLQMLPSLPIPENRAATLKEFLETCLAGKKNRFIRAWAYAGLHRLAMLHIDCRAEVAGCLKRALSEESPAVRARLRHLPPLG